MTGHLRPHTLRALVAIAATGLLAGTPSAMLAQASAGAGAQKPSTQIADTSSTPGSSEHEYLAKRQSTLDDIRNAERQLAQLRSERIRLESRVDSAGARAAAQRAQDLLMLRETSALRGLDSVLSSAQDNLLAQRDRFLLLGEAVRRRAAAEMVIVVRVDSGGHPAVVDSLAVQVDSAPPTVRRYSLAAMDALNAGAYDEIYHADVLPTTHTVTLSISINGSAQQSVVTVDVPTGTVTYVQCAIRAGQPVLSTWSRRSSSSS
jgi:hypothetical protein